MADKFTRWEDFESELNITSEEEAEIQSFQKKCQSVWY